jgi:hypothetical protein
VGEVDLLQQRIRTRILGAVLGLAMTSGFASAASATTYYLQGATFDDGTSVSGSFSTNVSGYFDGWDIKTVSSAIGGYHYVYGVINAGYNPGDSGATFNRPGYVGYFSLAAASPIDALTSGTLALTGISECDTYGPPCPVGHGRSFLSGSLSLTPAPEPAAWGLMVLGFRAIGFALRGKRAGRVFALAR